MPADDGAADNPPPEIAAIVQAAEAAGTGRLCLSSQGYTPYAPVGRGKMGDAGMSQLAGYLSASVTDLELDNAGLTEAGVETLAGVLDRGICRLTKLVLRHNLCGDRGCIAIAVGLKSPDSSIATLDLTKNKIGAEGAAALGDALRTNTTLTDLGMAKNPLEDAGCAAIADAVGANTESGLCRLDLSQCSFGDIGATALADALETDGGKQWGTQISALFLGRNAISDEGADVLADALEDSINLKELYLGGCRIKDRGAKLLVECLKVNASVINLNIGDNPIKEPMLRVIASALVEKNQALAKLTESLRQEKEKTTKLQEQVKQLTVTLAARDGATTDVAEPDDTQAGQAADGADIESTAAESEAEPEAEPESEPEAEPEQAAADEQKASPQPEPEAEAGAEEEA